MGHQGWMLCKTLIKIKLPYTPPNDSAKVKTFKFFKNLDAWSRPPLIKNETMPP